MENNLEETEPKEPQITFEDTTVITNNNKFITFEAGETWNVQEPQIVNNEE